MMPNSYPEWRYFQFAAKKHYGFVFLHTLHSRIVFKQENADIVLSILRYNMYTFDQEMFGSAPLYDVITSFSP